MWLPAPDVPDQFNVAVLGMRQQRKERIDEHLSALVDKAVRFGAGPAILTTILIFAARMRAKLTEEDRHFVGRDMARWVDYELRTGSEESLEQMEDRLVDIIERIEDRDGEGAVSAEHFRGQLARLRTALEARRTDAAHGTLQSANL